jgi:hypothetical protein
MALKRNARLISSVPAIFSARRPAAASERTSGLLLFMPSSSADAARETNPLDARAGVRADGPLTVDLSDPPAAGLLGFREVAGGDLLPERFVAILFPCVG